MPDLKVTQKHLEHDAYLYIRQSTPRQVLEVEEVGQQLLQMRDYLDRIHIRTAVSGGPAS